MTGRLRVAVHGGLATLFAATALTSVFEGLGWLFPVLGGIVVVVAVSELVRWSPVPSGIGPLLAAAGVLGYVTALYAPGPAYASVIPTGESMRLLGDVARAGFKDVNDLATPVPTHDGLVLLAVVGLAAVALLVDLFAVTMRHAAVAGLPLLAVFALCTSVAKHGASWITFVIGTTGYLWLLLADSRERLSRWGSPLGYDRDTRPHFNWSDSEVTPSPLSVMGRRIGLSAIAVAVVVPMAIPGLRGGVSHTGTGFGFGDGSSTAVTINPIVSIRAALHTDTSREVMLVDTTDQQPGYLRMTSLDNFDGQQFTPTELEAPVDAQVSQGLAAPVVEGTTENTSVTVEGLAVRWLPLPTQAIQVTVEGDWRYEPQTNTVFSARADTEGLAYQVQSVKPEPGATALRQATSVDPAMASYTSVPDSVSAQVRALAAKVTADAKTPFDKAVAIQRYLTSAPFSYTLNIPDTTSANPLDDFLFHTHTGFCQQYATAMAVLARVEHIPSRVAVGFTRGLQQQDGRWLITTHDAHAWPELYFTGFGWLPFEPTPRGDGQAVPPDYTVASTPGPTPQDGKTDSTGKGGKADTQDPVSKNQRLDDLADGAFAPSDDTGPAPSRGTSGRTLVAWTLLALLGIALVTPSVARLLTRRRRWRQAVTPAERATAAWAELRASAIDARVGWIDGLTPRATARVLRAEASGLATAEVRALERIVDAVQRAWYAPGHAPAGADKLEDDVDELRAAFLSEATLAERLMLRVWPRSTLRSARSVTGRLATVLDMVDLGLARLRARLRPRAAG